jgi:hypothetical protein
MQEQEKVSQNGKHRQSDDMNAQGLELAASMIREILVDFFGSLIPGFLFVMFAVPMVIWTLAMLLGIDATAWEAIFSPNFAIPSSVSSMLVFLVIALSYVLGFVFSRGDTQTPDQKSIAYILNKNRKNRDIGRDVIQERSSAEAIRESHSEQTSQLTCRNKQFCRDLSRSEGAQFPYSHLGEYLEARGLDGLAAHVPWRGKANSIDNRSKMFINILKIRLQAWNPRKCGDITRNEAHVRMMSSSWYAAQLLQWVYLALLALILAAWSLHQAWQHQFQPGFQFLSLIVTVLLVLLFAAMLLRRAIVTFLHYQRVREIVFVLGTAEAALKQDCDWIFDGFVAPPDQAKVVPSSQNG